MGRLLFLAILIVAGIWLVRRALARIDAREAPPPNRPVEDLVRCAQCGVLLPRAEARSAAGGTYCTEEHARLGPRRR